MKIGDQVQNLGVRVVSIQAIAFVLLGLLGARLYYLQIVKGDYYSERAENQRVRFIPIPAPRGAILDRNGKLLVDSRPTYNVVLSNEPLKKINVADRVEERLVTIGQTLESKTEITKGLLLDERTANARIRELSERYGLEVPPDAALFRQATISSMFRVWK